MIKLSVFSLVFFLIERISAHCRTDKYGDPKRPTILFLGNEDWGRKRYWVPKAQHNKRGLVQLTHMKFNSELQDRFESRSKSREFKRKKP